MDTESPAADKNSAMGATRSESRRPRRTPLNLVECALLAGLLAVVLYVALSLFGDPDSGAWGPNPSTRSTSKDPSPQQ